MPLVNYDEQDDEELIEEEEKYNKKLIFKSVNLSPVSLIPGDIIKLTYVNSGRKTLLISSSDRAPDGNFVSTRDNTLVCCFEVNPASMSFKVILKFFHNNKDRCNYYTMPRFLKYIFGLSAFKTLNINKMSYIQILLKEGEKIKRGI